MIDTVSSIPQSFLYEVNAQYKYKSPNNHNSYSQFLLKLLDRTVEYDKRIYPIGAVPAMRRKPVNMAKRKPAIREAPPTR